MPAPLRVILTPDESDMLRELRLATTVPQRTRDRAHLLRLNSQGWNTPELAEMFEVHPHTVRTTIKRWEERGLSGLFEAPGRGAKPRWTPEDLACVEKWVKEDPRTYNSSQLARKLKDECQVDLSSARLRELLQKKLSMETDSSKSPEQAKSSKTRAETSGP
jgi:transposase